MEFTDRIIDSTVLSGILDRCTLTLLGLFKSIGSPYLKEGGTSLSYELYTTAHLRLGFVRNEDSSVVGRIDEDFNKNSKQPLGSTLIFIPRRQIILQHSLQSTKLCFCRLPILDKDDADVHRENLHDRHSLDRIPEASGYTSSINEFGVILPS